MISKSHVTRFRSLPGRPEARDPHSLATARERAFWVLSVAKEDGDLEYLTPAQIADILCDVAGIQATRQQIAAALRKERQTVARRRRDGRDHYKLMKMGEDVLNDGHVFTATVVNPENALSEIRKVEDLLRSLKGALQICDPYVDKKTLDLLAECVAASSMSLLTVNVQKESAFRRDLEAFARQYNALLEVRVATGARLHDRYIIHDAGLLLLGGSLNGLGKKQSFIVELGDGLKALVGCDFERQWRTAANFA